MQPFGKVPSLTRIFRLDISVSYIYIYAHTVTYTYTYIYIYIWCIASAHPQEGRDEARGADAGGFVPDSPRAPCPPDKPRKFVIIHFYFYVLIIFPCGFVNSDGL